MQEYYSQWMKLCGRRVPDGLGGCTTEWIPEGMLLGAVTNLKQHRMDSAGRVVIRQEGLLVHEEGIQLKPGDRVKRIQDDRLFQVCGIDVCPPACSWIRMAQCPVESVEEGPDE